MSPIAIDLSDDIPTNTSTPTKPIATQSSTSALLSHNDAEIIVISCMEKMAEYQELLKGLMGDGVGGKVRGEMVDRILDGGE